MEARQALPVLSFPSARAWEEWLAENHALAGGIWLKIAKRASATRTIQYAEAVDVALCYGWVDGQKNKLDDAHWLQRFTPRRQRSRWSRINRQKAQELIGAGRMKPPGLYEVERAKADGRWDAAYEPQSSATVPEDLERELKKNPRAQKFFAALDSRNRYAILYRIQDAKRSETRANRIAKFVTMLEKHYKLYP